MTQSRELGPLQVNRIETYRKIQDQIKTLSDAREVLRTAILADLGDCETGTVDGVTVARKSVSDGYRFDTKGFRAEHPELYEEYRMPAAEPTVRLTVSDAA